MFRYLKLTFQDISLLYYKLYGLNSYQGIIVFGYIGLITYFFDTLV